MLTSSSYVVLLLPLPVLLLSGWFCHDRLAAWFNALLSIAVIIGCTIMYTRIFGPIIGSQAVSLMIIAAYATAITYGPLREMHTWLTVHMTSPLAVVAMYKISIQPQPTPEQRAHLRQWQPTPLPPVHEDYHGSTTAPDVPVPMSRPSSRPLQPPLTLPSSYQERGTPS